MAREARWQGAEGKLVRDAVANLSRRNRAMIYRSYYLGQTTTQIAAELQTDDDIIKQELHCALRALRETLDETGDMLR